MTEDVEQARGNTTAIRRFRVGFPEAELAELRRRVSATRWPERETVTDDSQGVRIAMMQELARYWATGYDWGNGEAVLRGQGYQEEKCHGGSAVPAGPELQCGTAS